MPERIPAKKAPIKKHARAITLLLNSEFFQSARQKIEIPSIAKENGIGFPENSMSLLA